jgi:hypothetical protein
MIKPQFPYTGSQYIATSDRVVMHSRKDGVYLFGKATVGMSSPGTVNVDSGEALKVNAPLIELGLNAQVVGENAVLGNTLVALLTELNDSLSLLATALNQVDGTTPESIKESLSQIKMAGSYLVDATTNTTNAINNILSDTTYLV